jgi:hypothetical protein
MRQYSYGANNTESHYSDHWLYFGSLEKSRFGASWGSVWLWRYLRTLRSTTKFFFSSSQPFPIGNQDMGNFSLASSTKDNSSSKSPLLELLKIAVLYRRKYLETCIDKVDFPLHADHPIFKPNPRECTKDERLDSIRMEAGSTLSGRRTRLCIFPISVLRSAL